MKENFVLINGNGLENGRMVRRALDPSQSKDKAKETNLTAVSENKGSLASLPGYAFWFHCLSYMVTICNELFVTVIMMVIDIVSLVLCEQPANYKASFCCRRPKKWRDTV